MVWNEVLKWTNGWTLDNTFLVLISWLKSIQSCVLLILWWLSWNSHLYTFTLSRECCLYSSHLFEPQKFKFNLILGCVWDLRGENSGQYQPWIEVSSHWTIVTILDQWLHHKIFFTLYIFLFLRQHTVFPFSCAGRYKTFGQCDSCWIDPIIQLHFT